MPKKVISIVLAFLCIFSILILSACGTKQAATSDTSSAAPATEQNTTVQTTASEKKSISLTVSVTSDDGKSEALADAFKKVEEVSGIKVQLNALPNDQALNIVKTKVATGNADDLFIHPWGAFELPVDQLAPLDGPWVSKIADVTLPFCLNYKDKKSIIKAPFKGQSNYGFIYNKTVLEKAGVKLPLKNFSEFAAACDAIKKTGVTPVFLSNKENWTAQVLFLTSMTGILKNNPEMVDKLAANKMKPSEIPQLVKLWENGQSLKTKGYINNDYMSATNEMGQKAIAEGKAAFYCIIDGIYGDMVKNYPDQVKNVGMTTVPLWDDEKDAMVMTNPSFGYISVPSNGKNVDAAKELVNVFMTQPVLTAFYTKQPGLAPLKDLGYELNVGPWNKEMGEYGKTIKAYGDWANSLYDGSPKLNSLWGDFNLHAQGLFSGKSAKDSLDGWYKKYVIDAKAKKLEGF